MGLTLTDAKRRVLNTLEEEPSHGYNLAKELGIQGPTIYDHLQELESAGYIKGEKQGRRIVYDLTERGRLILAAEQADKD